MPKYMATMVKGDPRDYPTQNITVFEPRASGSRERTRRVPHEFSQGRTIEVSEALARELRLKTQPVTRGPRMFKIVVVEDEKRQSAAASPAASPAPRPAPRRAPEPEFEPDEEDSEDLPPPPRGSAAKPPEDAPPIEDAKPAKAKPARPRPKKADL